MKKRTRQLSLNFAFAGLLFLWSIPTLAQPSNGSSATLTGQSLSKQLNFAQKNTGQELACKYDKKKPIYLYGSDRETEAMVVKILAYTGLQKNFVLSAANVDNAEAVICNNDRYILYNKGFIQPFKNATPDDWGPVSIMAHEIGHHLQGHTLLPGGSTPPIELEADQWSGFILQRMGATLEQAQAVMKSLADENGSTTHPGKKSRLAAIEYGWKQAKELVPKPSGRQFDPFVPRTSANQTLAENTIVDKFITFEAPKCKRSGSFAICRMLVTNEGPTRRVVFYDNAGTESDSHASFVIDGADNKYKIGLTFDGGANISKLDSVTSLKSLLRLDQSTEYYIDIVIDGLSPNTIKLNRLLLRYWLFGLDERPNFGMLESLPSNGTRGSLEFKNILLEKY